MKTRVWCQCRKSRWSEVSQRRHGEAVRPSASLWLVDNLLEQIILPSSSKVIRPQSKRVSRFATSRKPLKTFRRSTSVFMPTGQEANNTAEQPGWLNFSRFRQLKPPGQFCSSQPVATTITAIENRIAICTLVLQGEKVAIHLFQDWHFQ